jgi:hypothetical protein
VWDRTLDGRTLSFRLYGINNQNFIMRDDQTGSWWQQVSGEAIQGPLRGRRLRGIVHDEIAFGIFRAENPRGRVLRPVPALAAEYEPADWERRMKKLPTVTPRVAGDALAARTVVVGVVLREEARAWPFPLLIRQSPVLDTLAGVPLLIVVADDRKSIRVFDRTLDGRPLELLRVPGARPLKMVDPGTGSEWDFAGRAISGPLAGRRLTTLKALKEYWFDWRTYHPSTSVYRRE